MLHNTSLDRVKEVSKIHLYFLLSLKELQFEFKRKYLRFFIGSLFFQDLPSIKQEKPLQQAAFQN